VASSVARNVIVHGDDALRVAAELVDKLAARDLSIAFVFADWRIDTHALARALHRGLAPATSVGCTTIGVIGAGTTPAAAAVGLYGDAVRAGVGLATELSSSALTHGRDAIARAADALGTTARALDPARHVAVTFVDGKCGHEEAFCIGSAAAAPQIKVVGGCAATELAGPRPSFVWANGEALADAGAVVVLDCRVPFHAVTSSHLVPTDQRTVVTACDGRTIDELDGMPAGPRLRELIAAIGGELDDDRPSGYSFARFINGVPYVRSFTRIRDGRIHLASAVEVGHVLRVMTSGDLIATTRRDLAGAATRVESMAALLAFSCIGRHWEASARGLDGELAAAYAAYPTTGFQSMGEQTGMLLVNHTLTGLAIGDG
jgi:hypothetical protein